MLSHGYKELLKYKAFFTKAFHINYFYFTCYVPSKEFLPGKDHGSGFLAENEKVLIGV